MTAPELAAAMAENRELHALIAEILDRFGPSRVAVGNDHSARVSKRQMAEWRERAGLEPQP